MDDSFENWLSGRGEDSPEDDGELLKGTAIGDCRVVARLGRGGFADVYKAKDANGGFVAIKILHRLDDKSRARFARESEILSQIRHRSIPRLLGFGSCGERPYMIMELLRGEDLPSGDRRVASFLRQIASAAGELHRNGYVHRDIKPANVLWRADGTPVLIDFGLACPVSAAKRERDGLSTSAGKPVAVGTMGYAAPEQLSGLGAGPEADVHAIGAMMADCFPEKMPGCWRRIHLTATASNPQSRYRSAGALSKAIRMRHWRGMATAAAVAAVLCAIAVMFAVADAGSAAETPPMIDSSFTTQPFLVDMAPENAPDAGAEYSMRCQIVCNLGLSGRLDAEDAAVREKTGARLNAWLSELIAEEYAGWEFDDLVDEMRQEDLQKDLNESFSLFISDKMEEMDPSVRPDINTVVVLVEPGETLKAAIKASAAHDD